MAFVPDTGHATEPPGRKGEVVFLKIQCDLKFHILCSLGLGYFPVGNVTISFTLRCLLANTGLHSQSGTLSELCAREVVWLGAWARGSVAELPGFKPWLCHD